MPTHISRLIDICATRNEILRDSSVAILASHKQRRHTILIKQKNVGSTEEFSQTDCKMTNSLPPHSTLIAGLDIVQRCSMNA